MGLNAFQLFSAFEKSVCTIWDKFENDFMKKEKKSLSCRFRLAVVRKWMNVDCYVVVVVWEIMGSEKWCEALRYRSANWYKTEFQLRGRSWGRCAFCDWKLEWLFWEICFFLFWFDRLKSIFVTKFIETFRVPRIIWLWFWIFTRYSTSLRPCDKRSKFTIVDIIEMNTSIRHKM